MQSEHLSRAMDAVGRASEDLATVMRKLKALAVHPDVSKDPALFVLRSAEREIHAAMAELEALTISG